MILFIVLTYLYTFSEAEIYDDTNGTRLFNYFKYKYGKRYKTTEEEKRSLRNFVNNLNEVTSLNENTKDNFTVYVLNKFADVDPEDVKQHYSIAVKPYDRVEEANTQFLRQPKKTESLDIPLYDLDNAEELYNEFVKKYNKRNHTKPLHNTILYYRFVKTLAELNRNHYEGRTKLTLDENADTLHEPNEYFID